MENLNERALTLLLNSGDSVVVYATQAAMLAARNELLEQQLADAQPFSDDEAPDEDLEQDDDA